MLGFMKRFPDVLTLLTAFMVLFTVLTWVIPAGEFERQQYKNKQVVVPGTYHAVDQHAQGVMDFLTAPIKGFVAAADIIGFVFLVAGAFGIVQKTGAIEALLERVIAFGIAKPQFKMLILPLLISLFSLGGATFGMSEEVLVFVMLTIPLAHALGYDTVVGVAIPFVGAGVGFAGAFINPFTVGIAQGIAQLPPGSGFGYRLVCWVVFTLLAIGFICRYAARIAADPTRSVVHDAPSKWDRTAGNEALDMTGSRMAVLVLLMGTLGLLVYGVQTWGWYIEEIAGLFVGMGLLASLLGRLSAQDTVKAFTLGAADVVMASLIIGFSRGLLVIAEQGAIIDTILNSLAGLAEGLSPAVSVIVMFIFQSFLNFFVPSGSGQAALTMPLMAPLSDLLSVERQVAVLTFQFGDGISNLVIPTSGVTMGLLELAGIPYDRWFKFCFPLVLLLSAMACVLLVLPVTVFHWT
jgi:uncharacterized ion transporter superfamily protein YfcC